MASNGNLPDSALTSVPPGRLEKQAAAAWNAGPAKAGCKLLGPVSGYRPLAAQVFFWNNQPPLAARPGTSNHGWGRAVDLASPWMRTWIDRNGAKYGWKKTEAFSEWWHVNYVGGFTAPPPKPNPLRFLTRAQRANVTKLFYHRKGARKEAQSGKGPKYRRHVKWREHYKDKVKKQEDLASGRRKRVLKRVLTHEGATSGYQI